MKKFNISHIEYDLSGSVDLYPEEGVTLPETLTVYCESEDEIADTISDQTDFCVLGFVIDGYEEA